MKIYLTGASGTGKSTIIRALSERGIRAVDMDNGLCHWEHRADGSSVVWEPGRSEAWYEAHGWMCKITDLKTLLAEHTDIVVAGLSSNQDDYLYLFDKVLILHASPQTILSRLKSRTDSDYGKHPLEQQRLLKWHTSFEADMISKGAHPIDANRPLEEVVSEVISHLK